MNRKIPPLQFLYRDESIFAVNKPSGIHSVALLKKVGGDSVAELLGAAHPELIDVSPNAGDSGLVQRLDFETSGILIGASSRSIWERLKEDLKESSTKKRYRAVLDGNLLNIQTVTAQLGARRKGAKKVSVQKHAHEKGYFFPATTIFEPVQFFEKENCSLVTVTLIGGRRHQIRAHAGSIGYPLVGDSLYGSQKILAELYPQMMPPFLLHAWKLSIVHPVSGEKLELEAPLPEYFP